MTFRDEEYLGLHEALIDRAIFEQVQARRLRRGQGVHSTGKARGVLSGMIRCARCGSALHADRNCLGKAMYRERHGVACETNRRAFVAPPVDDQMGEIFRSLELRGDWRDAIASEAAGREGPNVDALLDQRRRIARAYGDGAYAPAEYEARLAAIDSEIEYSQHDAPVNVAEVAALLADLPTLWNAATPDERRVLLAPLVSSVFVDVASRRIAGIAPQPAFRSLLAAAITRTADCSAVLYAPDSSPVQGECGLGGDGGELNSPSSGPPPRICYGRSQWLISPVALH